MSRMKKPGYILNNPVNTRNNALVVIFLAAVKHVLLQPILIITNEVENWRDTFTNWSDNNTDITINSEKPLNDKMIYISSLDKALAISRREYSILVIDDEDATIKVKQLKSVMAGFKIVLTSVDLKKNYKTFYTIWINWIDPKSREKFALEKVLANGASSGSLERCILMDYIFQDKVLRWSDIHDGVENEPRAKKKAPRTTVKNKDATGTKIKRSKPKRPDNAPRDSPTDSSRFEFETLPHSVFANVSEGVNENGAMRSICDEADEIMNEEENSKGVKRKHARILQSDSDSEPYDTKRGQKDKTECRVETDSDGEEASKEIINKNCDSINDTEGIEQNPTCVNDVDLTKSEQLTEQGSVIRQNKKSVSSQKYNELMDISPDLFSFIDTENAVIASKKGSHSPVCKAEVLIEDNMDACIAKGEVSNGLTETGGNSKIETQASDVRNEIDKNETSVKNTCGEVQSTVFDEKMKDLQEKTFNKFKGSILDCLF